MHYRAVIVAVFLSLSSFAHAQSPATNPTPSPAIPTQDLYQRLAPSVVTIIVSDRSGRELGSGSGLILSQDGAILTNHHVVEGGTFFDVRLHSFQKDTIPLQGRPFKADKEHDLAVIRISPSSPLSPVTIAKVLPTVGSRVYAIGSPLALEGSISEGIVSQIRTQKGASLIQTTAPISPGSSGGGLFLETGELVGVTTMTLVEGQGLNFAVSCIDLSMLSPVSEFAGARRQEPIAAQSVAFGGATLTLGMPKKQVLSMLPGTYIRYYLGGNPDSIVFSEKIGDRYESKGTVGFKDGRLSYASVSWPIGPDQVSLASALFNVFSTVSLEAPEIVLVSTKEQRGPDGRIETIEFLLDSGKKITIGGGIYKGESYIPSIMETISLSQ